MSEPLSEREAIRRLYVTWRAGAGLERADMARLAEAAGLGWSNNRLRNAGLTSDRGEPITTNELLALMQAWAEKQRAERGGEKELAPPALHVRVKG